MKKIISKIGLVVAVSAMFAGVASANDSKESQVRIEYQAALKQIAPDCVELDPVGNEQYELRVSAKAEPSIWKKIITFGQAETLEEYDSVTIKDTIIPGYKKTAEYYSKCGSAAEEAFQTVRKNWIPDIATEIKLEFPYHKVTFDLSDSDRTKIKVEPVLKESAHH